jgi:acetyltransferase-like isoleucine patch superfamily enzyme
LLQVPPGHRSTLAKPTKPVNYIAPDAKLGKNVKVWNFTYVGSKTVIGDNVKIGSLAHVDYGVRIGSGTMIEGMVYIPPLSKIGKNVFIGPAAALTNDPYPPSKRMVGVTIEDGAVIGARAVIKAGVKVGKRSVVAMGAVVTKDVPAGMVVMGVPAKVTYSREEFDAKMKEWEAGASPKTSRRSR